MATLVSWAVSVAGLGWANRPGPWAKQPALFTDYFQFFVFF
jgi:hypothetical protein